MKLKIKDSIQIIRNSSLWLYLIRYTLKPIYSFLWKNIINFQGRILYIFFHSHKKIDEDFNLNYFKNDKKIIYNDPGFNQISKIIYENINKNNLVQKSYEKLNSGNFSAGDNQYKSGSNAFVDDLFDQLDDNVKEDIIKFSINHKIFLSASKYLGVVPVIAKINVLHNIENKTKAPRASMLWHKDDFGYRSLDLFLAISDIDENNGPLEFVKKKNPLGIFFKIKSDLDKQEPGQRNKIQNTQFSKYFNENDTDKFIGKSGSGILIDSFTVYHRGGNCNSNNRLVLRVSYQTPDSYTLSKKDKYAFKKYLINKKVSNNILSNYTLTKRNLIDLSKYLLRFYRIFHYKA